MAKTDFVYVLSHGEYGELVDGIPQVFIKLGEVYKGDRNGFRRALRKAKKLVNTTTTLRSPPGLHVPMHDTLGKLDREYGYVGRWEGGNNFIILKKIDLM